MFKLLSGLDCEKNCLRVRERENKVREKLVISFEEICHEDGRKFNFLQISTP